MLYCITHVPGDQCLLFVDAKAIDVKNWKSNAKLVTRELSGKPPDRVAAILFGERPQWVP